MMASSDGPSGHLAIRRLSEERFAVQALAIQTPEGRKLIPNPFGHESIDYPSLEAATQAIRQAGFDAVYEGALLAKADELYSPKQTAQQFATITHQDASRWDKTLIELLRNEKHPTVLASAAKALGTLKHPDSIEPLCLLLSHEEGAVRQAAAEGLSPWGVDHVERILGLIEVNLTHGPSEAYRSRLGMLTLFQQWSQSTTPLPASLHTIVRNCLRHEHWLVRSQGAVTIEALLLQVQRLQANGN